MEVISVYPDTYDIEEGIRRVGEELSKRGISEDYVISVIIERGADFQYPRSQPIAVIHVLVRENDQIALIKKINAELKRAKDLLHDIAVRVSSGQVLDIKEINKYLS